MNIAQPLTFELHSPADMAVLSWVRGVVVHTAEQLGFDGDDLHKIELSVDEACANVIEHAYTSPPEDSLPLVIRLEADALCLRISVIDRGIGAGDLPGAVQSIEEYTRVKRFRGLGTYIMQRFMDEVEFSQMPGEGTRVSMVKNIPSPEHAVGE